MKSLATIFIFGLALSCNNLGEEDKNDQTKNETNEVPEVVTASTTSASGAESTEETDHPLESALSLVDKDRLPSRSLVETVLNMFDGDGNKALDVDELIEVIKKAKEIFMKAGPFHGKKPKKAVAKFKEAFDCLDADDNGELDETEILDKMAKLEACGIDKPRDRRGKKGKRHHWKKMCDKDDDAPWMRGGPHKGHNPGQHNSLERIQKRVDCLDTDGNGELSVSELVDKFEKLKKCREEWDATD